MMAKYPLQHGPYRAPAVQPGDLIDCVRYEGPVCVGGFTRAPIPWPLVEDCGRPQLVLTGDLLRALAQEQTKAVAWWWGVSDQTVRNWRTLLGIEPGPPGNRPWQEGELALVRDATLTAAEVAARTGRTPDAVYLQRGKAGVQGRKAKAFPWTEAHDARIRERYHTARAALLAEIGCSDKLLRERARQLGLALRPHRMVLPPRPWLPEDDAELAGMAQLTARAAAERLGRTASAVTQRRIALRARAGGGS
ncbi:MAG TPA: hypothetical protein VGD46_20175 [Rhizobacter sp.]